ncbi:MAG: response regulator transcription factor [Oscillospiraceae bacterium]|nr:response regulator transcription factor [Oscillospiraceae bacterium]
MFNILIVEDDESTRTLMCAVLKKAGYAAWPAADGVQALELMDHQQIDLAVVDVMMPNMDGYEFTRTLREGACETPVLMVTAKVSKQDKQQGFLAGTDDYMVKPIDEDEMLWRISALLRRSKSVSEHRLQIGSTTLDYNAFQVTEGGRTRQLTPKEFLLLYKFLSYPRKMFTKRQLLDEIWNMDSEVNEHTVEVHVYNLRDKFRDNPDFEIRTIRGFGYMAILREGANEER